MEMKPYEKLLERVKQSTSISEKNKQGLIEFIEDDHPGNVMFTKWDEPAVMGSAKGNKMWDLDGKEYIDCLVGMSCMNIGHADPRMMEAIAEQYEVLDTFGDAPTPERIKLARRIAEMAPGDFEKRIQFGLSGSEVVEFAIRAARAYTKKTHIISFYGGYHGCGIATIGLTASGGMHRWYNVSSPWDNGLERFPYAYCYRCPYGKDQATCNCFCAQAVEDAIESGRTSLGKGKDNNIAAMIVEPMQGSAGYLLPPKGFLARLREIADKYGFLLICDEIQCGMGRTGKMFACQHSDVAPDILLMAKALGNGLPMSACVVRKEIYDVLAPGFTESAFTGYPCGCAAANKVFDIYESDKVVERCAKTGEYLAKTLESHYNKHPLVGTYSQTGVWLGIEYVMDRTTKDPAREETSYLINRMNEEGLLCQINGYYGNRISFIPPINITESDVDDIFAIMDRLTEETERKFGIIGG